MSGLIDRARRSKKKIVFPEGADPRVLDAAAGLAQNRDHFVFHVSVLRCERPRSRLAPEPSRERRSGGGLSDAEGAVHAAFMRSNGKGRHSPVERRCAAAMMANGSS